MIRPPPSSPLFPYTPLFRSPWPMPVTSSAISCRSSAMAAPSCLARCSTPTACAAISSSRGRGLRHFPAGRSEEHTSELQSHLNLVCRLLLEKKKKVATLHSRPNRLKRYRVVLTEVLRCEQCSVRHEALSPHPSRTTLRYHISLGYPLTRPWR